MDASRGVCALRLLRPVVAIPVHYDDYTVFRSTLEEFCAALALAEDLETSVHELSRGETYRFDLH